LELAEGEFLAIRNLGKQKAHEAAQAISTGQDNIRLDASTLNAFVAKWPGLSRCW
jgi:hypothetical protein